LSADEKKGGQVGIALLYSKLEVGHKENLIDIYRKKSKNVCKPLKTSQMILKMSLCI